MKKSIIFICVLLFTVNLLAQKEQLEYSINKSLTFFIEKLKENQEKGMIDQNYFDNLYLSVDNYPTHYQFEDSISGLSVNYISLVNCSGYEKKLKNGIWVISLNNLSLENNKLIIVYTLKKAILKKKNQLNLILSDSITFVYEYNCDNNEWTLTNTKYTGV